MARRTHHPEAAERVPSLGRSLVEIHLVVEVPVTVPVTDSPWAPALGNSLGPGSPDQVSDLDPQVVGMAQELGPALGLERDPAMVWGTDLLREASAQSRLV